MRTILTGALLVALMAPLYAEQPVSRSGWVPDPNASPTQPVTMPCTGPACAAGASYQFFTDEADFIAAIASGFYDEDFADIPVGAAGASLSFTGNGYAYTVTAFGDGSNDLFNDPGLLSLDSAVDTMRITFTGDPVRAVGGNLFATDINFSFTGGSIELTLEDGSTETLASTSGTTFAGFVTSQPIVFIDIFAPNVPASNWPAINQLFVGTEGNAFSIGGSLAGLAAGNSVVLQNNGGDDLTLSDNGSFTFDTPVADGESYLVTVLTQPEGPNQICTVINGSGDVDGAEVTDIEIDCVTETYTIGGTVSGLAGGTVVLQNSGGDDLAVGADGTFSFSTALDDGSSYEVTVLTQPSSPDQICTVSAGSGTVSGANVGDVEVSCATETYTIGGNLAGLAAGNTVVLQNNGADDLALNSNDAFVFATPLADGSAYNVTVLTQPDGQFCSISDGSGTLAGGDVDDVSVSCDNQQLNVSTVELSIGNVAPGASGSGVLTVSNTGAGDVEVNSIGGLTSPFAISGGSCPMAPFTLAAGQSCTVEIEFSPQASGSFESTLSIDNSATEAPISVTVRGQSSAAIAVPVMGGPGLLLMATLLLLMGFMASKRANGLQRPI